LSQKRSLLLVTTQLDPEPRFLRLSSSDTHRDQETVPGPTSREAGRAAAGAPRADRNIRALRGTPRSTGLGQLRGRKKVADAVRDLPLSPPTSAASSASQSRVTIVPVAGLPIAAAALAFLVAAIVGNWLWALDFIHVAGGGLWTGIDLFVGLVIGPIIGRMSVPARVEFSMRFMPKMVLLMPTLVVLTLASGLQLARNLGDLAVPYPNHWWLVASLIVVGVMAVIALGLLEPANLAVLFELKKPRPNGLLIAKLMRRFIYTAGITGLMQIAILITMTRIATW